jgi:hypothetical protein
MRSGEAPLSSANQLLSGEPEIECLNGVSTFCKQSHHHAAKSGSAAPEH